MVGRKKIIKKIPCLGNRSLSEMAVLRTCLETYIELEFAMQSLSQDSIL